MIGAPFGLGLGVITPLYIALTPVLGVMIKFA
jgi:hypothetical protein